jgi:hypothetical protein
MDCSSRISEVIYFHLEVARRVSCARKNAEAIVNIVIVSHSVGMVI